MKDSFKTYDTQLVEIPKHKKKKTMKERIQENSQEQMDIVARA